MEDIIEYLIITLVVVAIVYVALNGGLQIISNLIYPTTVTTVTTSIPQGLNTIHVSGTSVNENIEILNSTNLYVTGYAIRLKVIIRNHATLYLNIPGSRNNISVQGGLVAILITGINNAVNLNGTNVLSEVCSVRPNTIGGVNCV